MTEADRVRILEGRARQGFGPTVADPGVLRVVADLIAPNEKARRALDLPRRAKQEDRRVLDDRSAA